ncbi:molybdopterin molybdotransferase MoeA [Verminephrobacter eiseniae]|uniref:molybdopterin molybdotransferase MoeA n=1 Tax=Verminephrobacter eiseniae TaxID=364317 RepID=UPI00223758AD|nr:molybdopterin molybdotransferase MoeA [Verminephrobacter eiseniae]MCW5286913.1 molybdopterin molybdenumtransferase MoeA [Verminephrobacter eiseniae]MCW5305211.1 molybdopterin molybdenumtransferase MoeA [Verminephrobacter eiseniae]MCW8189493.1 molybdopterin molybdenumtransferase MoeA [Verminephrobacter eiseniae]
MKTIARIAADLPGYDPQALSVAEADAFLQQLVEPVDGAESATEELGLCAALGRVLARDVIAPISVPPHDNSAMDGYAFAGAPLRAGQPLRLRVAGTALAGRVWAAALAPGECLKIMTGALLPAGLDTVVPQELASALEEGHITIAPGLLQPGDNRRRAGEDLQAGRVALAQGALLTPAALGLLASLGLASVSVRRRLRVAYFSTGDEILSLGQPARAGAVYDSNRYTLFGLLTRLGVQVIDMGVVRDDPAALRAALLCAAPQADAIITSGGVSVGEADHLRAMLHEIGDMAFWRIAMRPGRPMAVGRIAAPQLRADGAGGAGGASSARPSCADGSRERGGTLLFGLPGNPVAAMVSFLVFVRPALLRMMGSTQAAAPLLRAISTEALRKKPGRTEYQRGCVSTAPDGWPQVRSTGDQGSGLLSSMVQANGLIVLHHHRGPVAAGEPVDVLPFDGAI